MVEVEGLVRPESRTLEVEPHSVGTIDGEAGLVGGPAVRFRQLAFF